MRSKPIARIPPQAHDGGIRGSLLAVARRNVRRVRVAVVGCVLLALQSGTLSGTQEVVDRIVAVVGEEVITLSEAERARRVRWLSEDEDRLSLAEAVERLVERLLIEREVRRNPDRQADESLFDLAEKSLAQIRDGFVSPSAYQDALAAYQMRESDVFEELRRQHAVTLFLERRFRALMP